MNYRLRSNGGLVYFTPKLRVAYRPRGDVRSLASQYYHYGRWRYEVMRRHPASVNLRYLAPPTALLALVGGTIAGVAGTLTWPWLMLGFAAPVTYVAAVLAASVLTSRGLAPGPRALLNLVYPTMHITWGAGFLSSVMSYRQRGRQ